jgi:hypothetical protein
VSGAARSRRAVVPARAAGGLICLLLVACGAGDRADARAGSAPAAAAVDWRSTTYELTCDGVVPGGFRAQVVDGAASVPADGTRPPYYDHYEVRVVTTADGDLDGDGGAETVVLLECSPQPSNGILQEVQVHASSGRLLGSLPSPRTLQGDAPLPPVYQRISVRGGLIVAGMSAYADTDSHASGPSEPFTLRFGLGPAGVELASPS